MMEITLVVNEKDPRTVEFLPAILVGHYIEQGVNDGRGRVSVKYEQAAGNQSAQPVNVLVNGERIETSCSSLIRVLGRVAQNLAPNNAKLGRLYGGSVEERSVLDSWITLVTPQDSADDVLLELLNQALSRNNSNQSFIVGDMLTVADILVWSVVRTFSPESLSPNASKWMQATTEELRPILGRVPQPLQAFETKKPQSRQDKKVKFTSANKENASSQQSTKAKDEGKFLELEGAEKGKVVVRFPPEASGYLHIGHAKAALLNQYYKQAYEGKLVFRFDDTNPEKEKEDFEHVIIEDVAKLQIQPDVRSYTSDYFELFLQYCEQLIKSGLAYVDDTPAEQMKIEREQKAESKNRNNSVEKNLKMWEDMKKGTQYGHQCCVRAKIDMNSDNGCMRDPTIYRCKDEPHPRTGNKYKVYPTYDFACPIVDSIEGITHALRTTEYMDRDAQYYWFCDALKIRKPKIWAYARLNMMNTLMSKRKLTWLVQEGIVEGWEDPRMPTVRGVLRRGLTVEGLKQFIVAQGSSRSVVFMEWDKIWAFNKKVIDPIAPRYSGVEVEGAVMVTLDQDVDGELEVNLHPKNPEVGKRKVKIGKKLLIDQTDAQAIKEGDNVTFINWGNILIKKIQRGEKTGFVTGIEGSLNLENRDFKKTLKVTWLEGKSHIPATCVYYEHLISKPVLGKDDDFKEFLNRDTKMEIDMKVDADLKNLKKGDIIQLQRKGFFICDQVHPLRLISIPDGSIDLNAFPKRVQEWKKKHQDIAQQHSKSTASAPQVPTASASKPSQKGPANDALTLWNQTKACGDEIRKLKSEKAPKDVVDAKVRELLSLKAKYKEITNTEYDQNKPPLVQTSSAPTHAAQAVPSQSSDATSLWNATKACGDEVRKLKSEKASKEVVDAKVKELLSLKAKYKEVTNTEYDQNKPPSVQTSSAPAAQTMQSPSSDAMSLWNATKACGDEVRNLKSQKAEKSAIDSKVKDLLALKAKYKELTGSDYDQNKPPSVGQASPAPVTAKQQAAPASQQTVSTAAGSPELIAQLDAKIKEQGDKIRQLKQDKKLAKSALQPEIDTLLNLKAGYKKAAGKDWAPDSTPAPASASKPAGDAPKKASEPKKQVPQKKEEKKKSQEVAAPSAGPKKQTRLGLEAKKSEDFAEWYTEVITKAEMIEYYDVSGCYILRPWAFSVWEAITQFFDMRIKGLGVQNCYFPMFVSGHALEKEKTHIADFAPEVAWVTKSGQSDMAEPVAIRPTSETVMYPSYAKWVQSHRDLPIKLNQWCNVVRWEFKNPTPFLRTREFLWQEGHSAFATKPEAEEEVLQILEFYAQVYEDLLAIPVIRGRKTEKEKFAGGDYTTTVEGYISANGRGIQGGTSHHLGQNFSKMFEIMFEDPEKPGSGEKRYAYQNSWGLSTRTIGVMIMVHSDDKGLVLPPNVACVQVVIVPCGITASLSEEKRRELLDACTRLECKLRDVKIKVKSDLSDNYSPGWKFNHWELKGVPIRIELGPKDLEKEEFVAVRRDNGVKSSFKIKDAPSAMKKLLQDIQDSLYAKALKERDENLAVTEKWDEFLAKLDQKCIIMAPFCGAIECEETIKKESTKEDTGSAAGPLMGAKSLCIPFKQPKQLAADAKCLHPRCNRKPLNYTLFGRSY